MASIAPKYETHHRAGDDGKSCDCYRTPVMASKRTSKQETTERVGRAPLKALLETTIVVSRQTELAEWRNGRPELPTQWRVRDLISGDLSVSDACNSYIISLSTHDPSLWDLLNVSDHILPQPHFVILTTPGLDRMKTKLTLNKLMSEDLQQDIQSQKDGKLHVPISVVSCFLFS
ncbi:hypothetical protein AAG570_009403 [Ranatra chinensis]|uniref:Uncharacterized protein n=1 Tax=Ranatra chinensis TaxID=642074 RepID=A0ABD0Z1Z5_9HEMI